MTKEQAIEVLNTYYRGEDNDDREFCSAIDMAIKALEQEPCEDAVSREEVTWISVSERLPEEMGTYMTAIDYGEHGLVIGQRYYYGRGLKWNGERVIAWMPLPEPYEDEEEEEEE